MLTNRRDSTILRINPMKESLEEVEMLHVERKHREGARPKCVKTKNTSRHLDRMREQERPGRFNPEHCKSADRRHSSSRSIG